MTAPISIATGCSKSHTNMFSEISKSQFNFNKSHKGYRLSLWLKSFSQTFRQVLIMFEIFSENSVASGSNRHMSLFSAYFVMRDFLHEETHFSVSFFALKYRENSIISTYKQRCHTPLNDRYFQLGIKCAARQLLECEHNF